MTSLILKSSTLSNESLNKIPESDTMTYLLKNSMISLTKSNNLPESSSNSSSLENSNSSYTDDEECFYDAIDAVECNEFYSALSDLTKISNNKSSETTSEEGEESDEADESKHYFFDTATSRHPSEFNNNNNSKPHTSLPKILVNDTCDISCNINNEESKESSNTKLNSTENSVVIDEEDDCEDAELETSWSFWIDRSVRGTTKNEYEAGLKLIHTVNTVQTFWSVCNNIPDISQLPVRYSYHLMRNTRRPLWEDPENARGGQWKFKCKKEDTSLVWNEALLASIGEQLSDCVSSKDDIVGISVSRREKDDVIQVWNLDQNYQSQATIVNKLQELVPDVKFSVVFYKAHSLNEAFEGKKSSPRNKNGQKYQNNKSSDTRNTNNYTTNTNQKNNDKKYKT